MQGSHLRRARAIARLCFAGAALCLLVALSVTRTPRAEAAPGGTVAMSPGNSSINVGDTIAITLDVVGGVDVHEVLLQVTYNPVVVQVIDANAGAAGVQILPGAFPGTTASGNVIQNSAASGAINYQFELNDPSGQTSGSGTMATVQFLAIAVGNANIAWATKQLTDAGGASVTPGGGAAVLAVGQAVATSTPTATGTPTDTPAPTATPSPTNTPAPTTTGTPAASQTPGAGSLTPVATNTGTPSPVPTPGASTTPSVTTSPAATSTVRVTVIEDSNAGEPPQSGVDPSQTSRANGLPSAGNEGPGVRWWRWVFFLAALMLGIAGWFFTFAIHYGDREPILVDRFDRLRRRRR